MLNNKDQISAENNNSIVLKNDLPENSRFTNYSQAKLANAEKGNVVLFFNASWCPTCQSTVKDIKANEGNIAENLTILSLDFDKETELKRKYSVTTQHTFVKVDKDGNLIKKASGLDKLSDINNFANN